MKSIDNPTRSLRYFSSREFPAPPRLDSGSNLAFFDGCIHAARHLSVIWIQTLAGFDECLASVNRFPSLVALKLFPLPACNPNTSGPAK